MKPKFTIQKIIGIILAVAACFPALEPHIGLIGQLLVGSGGLGVALLGILGQKKSESLKKAEEGLAELGE